MSDSEHEALVEARTAELQAAAAAFETAVDAVKAARAEGAGSYTITELRARMIAAQSTWTSARISMPEATVAWMCVALADLGEAAGIQ